jgi:uncharacterized protein (DUF488 family)
MTIGHSTHTLEEFIHLLQVHGAACVVDVRTVPRSRHSPQFNQDSLPQSLTLRTWVASGCKMQAWIHSLISTAIT